jgi:hypothetical protein
MSPIYEGLLRKKEKASTKLLADRLASDLDKTVAILYSQCHVEQKKQREI